jgi:hypothetical protein
MNNIIAFPRLQADACRLHNRYFEMRAEPEREPESMSVTPTPYGWLIIGLAMFWAAARR